MKSEAPSKSLTRHKNYGLVQKNLVLVNPDYQKKVRMHLWVGDTLKQSFPFLYSMNGNDLILPFGCLRSILPLLEGYWKKLYRKPVRLLLQSPAVWYQEEAGGRNAYQPLRYPAFPADVGRQMGIAWLLGSKRPCG